MQIADFIFMGLFFEFVRMNIVTFYMNSQHTFTIHIHFAFNVVSTPRIYEHVSLPKNILAPFSPDK